MLVIAIVIALSLRKIYTQVTCLLSDLKNTDFSLLEKAVCVSGIAKTQSFAVQSRKLKAMDQRLKLHFTMIGFVKFANLLKKNLLKKKFIKKKNC